MNPMCDVFTLYCGVIPQKTRQNVDKVIADEYDILRIACPP